MIQHHLREITQSNWTELRNGGPDRLPAFNQLDIRQDEAFITPCLRGRRGVAGHKDGQFDLDELFRVSGLAEMSFCWEQPPQQECFQVTLIAPPPIKPCQKGRRQEESCRSLPKSSSVMKRVAGWDHAKERWAISELQLLQKMLILLDKKWGQKSPQNGGIAAAIFILSFFFNNWIIKQLCSSMI